MKKMVKRNPEELNFEISGCSTQFGIQMCAGAEEIKFEVEDMLVLKFCSGAEYPGAFAYLEEDGTVSVHNERVFEPKEEEMKQIKKDNKCIQRIRTGFFVAFVAFWILMIPSVFIHEYLPSLCMAIGFLCLGCSKISALIFQYALRCFGSERIRRIHRYHSAEHAAINAFYDLKRIPTLEEVKNYSNYSYYCGTVYYIRDAIGYFVIGLCRLIPGFWPYIAALAVVMPIVIWVVKKKAYIFEYFSLLEPTDKEYEVAIAALDGALTFKNHVDDVREIVGLINGGSGIAHFVIKV